MQYLINIKILQENTKIDKEKRKKKLETVYIKRILKYLT